MRFSSGLPSKENGCFALKSEIKTLKSEIKTLKNEETIWQAVC